MSRRRSWVELRRVGGVEVDFRSKVQSTAFFHYQCGQPRERLAQWGIEYSAPQVKPHYSTENE